MLPSERILTFILGVLGGATATLLWEVVLRPIFARRAIAEVLAAEISINLQLLAAAESLANPKKIPPDLSLSTKVFESITDQVGNLTPRLVAEVVFLYRYFFDLNEHPKAYTACIIELRGYEPGSSNYSACEKELLTQVKVFNHSVVKAINRVNLTQPLLLKAAFPWWSIRRWRRPTEAQINITELQEQIAKSKRERDSLAEEVERRASA